MTDYHLSIYRRPQRLRDPQRRLLWWLIGMSVVLLVALAALGMLAAHNCR